MRTLLKACPDCGGDMVLRETRKFTPRDGRPRKFYGCIRWPECNGIHGAHPRFFLAAMTTGKTSELREIPA